MEKKKSHMVNPPEKWTISVGLHRPIMSSDKWISIQNQFGKNVINKTRKYKIGILKGALHCSCGYTMRVQHKVDKKYNKIYDNYFCQNRNRRGTEYCNCPFTSVATLDKAVIEILKNIAVDKSTIDNYIYEDKTIHACLRSKSDIQKDIDKTVLKINNLTATLGTNAESVAAKYIIQEIEKLDRELTGLKYELLEAEHNERKSKKANEEIEDKYKNVCYIVENLDILEYDDLNGLIKNLLKECIWDGVSLKIKL